MAEAFGHGERSGDRLLHFLAFQSTHSRDKRGGDQRTVAKNQKFFD